MRRIQDTNVGPGDTFISANPSTNEPGTIVRKDHKNDVQEELCRAIESTGQAVDTTLYSSGPGNRDQIAQMAAHYGAGGASYFIEDVTSAADAYVVKPVQIAIRDRKAPAALFDRQSVIFIPSNSNTGASTVDVSLLLGQSLGTSIIDIKLAGGIQNIEAGDMVSGTESVIVFRTSPSSHFELVKAENSLSNKITKPYSSKIDYVAGDSVLGASGFEYTCELANGPSTTVVNPDGDATGTWLRGNKTIFTASSLGDFYECTGPANTYVATPVFQQDGIKNLEIGMRVRFIPSASNTGASTLDVNGLGARPIAIGGANIAAGPLKAGEFVTVEYNGASWEIDLPRAVGENAQSWQDVTGARLINVTYTNTTGAPIVFMPRILDANPASLIITVDGLDMTVSGSNAVGEAMCNGVIIPQGSTYKYRSTAATIYNILAYELR